MLLEFSVSNFRSIKSMQTLSFVAAPIVSKDKTLDDVNVFEAPDGTGLLKTLAIYGANGSGKSNIVKALLAMLFMIRDSFADEDTIFRANDHFQLDSRSESKPVFFQIIFFVNDKKFRYGFEV